MHDALIRYINSYASTSLTEGEISIIINTFATKKIKKKFYFLREGEVNNEVGFIVKGAMRQYTVDNKGTEHIVGLLIENWWVVDRESNSTLRPSVYNIDAWEDTDLLIVTKTDFWNRLGAIPAIKEMVRKLDENYAVATQRRMTANISLPAEERYTVLRKEHPEFLQRFPQHLIASYLGITKETLSRVRRQLANK